jgi:hypothetical protein
MVTGSDNPDSLVTGTQEMQNHEGRTYDASDLSEEAPDKGYESIMVPGQASWTPSSDPAVVVARRKLVRAQQRASAAMARYGQMMEDDFPRGAARLEITQERDDAMKALEAAKAELESVDGGVPANGW